MPVDFFGPREVVAVRTVASYRKPGGGQRERVLRTEMKLLGESESRRSDAGEHRRRREQAGVLRGSSTREDRHDVELRHRVVAAWTRSIGSFGIADRSF